MLAFDVTINGKTYDVVLPDPCATPLQIIVDGQRFEVGIVGRNLELTAAHNDVARGDVAGFAPRPHLPQIDVALPRAAVGTEARGDITAPMPGTILLVSVKEGQTVEAGQIVCVLEAMKMKNPIRACHSGTVMTVAAHAGQNVAHGDLIVRLG